MGAPLTVRDVRHEDAGALGRVHVAAWLGAYRGLIPDTYLDAMDVERWARGWDRMITDGRARNAQVAERDGELVGFVDVGPDRSPGEHDPVGRGELYAINVTPHAWGTGAGPALLAAGEARLLALGFHDVVLWVLPGNARARRFYERSGWADDGMERTETVNGASVVERRYARSLDPTDQPSSTR